jgi:hypothetical protein
MTAKRIVVVIVGFAVGLGITLGVMALFSGVGMLNFGLPNILLTSFCFGCAAVILLDGVMHTNMLKR